MLMTEYVFSFTVFGWRVGMLPYNIYNKFYEHVYKGLFRIWLFEFYNENKFDGSLIGK